ncbi:MAG TPA: cupredoxin domain-containing protein [Nitrospira sp.]|nr:cupredoxin domain-containing protein [Nitrospira sp.]
MKIYRQNHTREEFAARRSAARNIAVAVFGGLWLLQVSLADSSPSLAATLVVEPSADGVQRATIVMESYSYIPDHLVLHVGSPVELILENKSWLVPHNFILQDADADLRLEADVAGGDRTILRFTPTRSGTGTFYCDKKLLFFKSHRHRGMEGWIDIQ